LKWGLGAAKAEKNAWGDEGEQVKRGKRGLIGNDRETGGQGGNFMDRRGEAPSWSYQDEEIPRFPA